MPVHVSITRDSVGLASNSMAHFQGCRSVMTALPEHLSSKAWGRRLGCWAAKLILVQACDTDRGKQEEELSHVANHNRCVMFRCT